MLLFFENDDDYDDDDDDDDEHDGDDHADDDDDNKCARSSRMNPCDPPPRVHPNCGQRQQIFCRSFLKVFVIRLMTAQVPNHPRPRSCKKWYCSNQAQLMQDFSYQQVMD